MPQCPNCSYLLVFLSNRLKYKCAKCGRLFLQKSTENRHFKVWNTTQRKIDKHNINIKQKRIKLTPEQKKLKIKQWKLDNIDKCREYNRKHYEDNRDKILAKKKIYRQLAKDNHNKWRKRYRKKLIQRTRLLARIQYWRVQQAKLTQQHLKNSNYRPYIRVSDASLSAFGLP